MWDAWEWTQKEGPDEGITQGHQLTQEECEPTEVWERSKQDNLGVHASVYVNPESWPTMLGTTQTVDST